MRGSAPSRSLGSIAVQINEQLRPICGDRQDTARARRNHSLIVNWMATTDTNQAKHLRNAAEAAMRAHGFEPEFSAEVVREVRALNEPADNPQPPEVRDMRAALWSSIDNRESRDLDQIEVAERVGDSIRVSSGVADVDSLVPVGSPADEHAAMNTTSVYTGVVTFPMLPERLSTDLTSLNEGEDRLAVVVQFDVDPNGGIGETQIFRALLR